MSTTDGKPVWFITGCSTGFGRELARHTLQLGYPTVVTARNRDQISDLVLGNEEHSLALNLDVTDSEQIAASVKAAIDNAGARMAMIRSYSGNQPGDPVRAAKAIVKAVKAPNPPLRLLLGKPAQGLARGKLESLRKDFEEWAELAASADFPSAN
jgi:NADP-dependent 3-hydroxy acid dehydrogenase YdfG